AGGAVGWHAQGQLRHAGDPGGYGGHEHRGRVCGTTAGDVETGTIDGNEPPLDAHSPTLVDVIFAELVHVEVADRRLSGLQRGAQLCGHRLESGGDLLDGDPHRLEAHAVEALGQLHQRRVAFRADPAQDLLHRSEGRIAS